MFGTGRWRTLPTAWLFLLLVSPAGQAHEASELVREIYVLDASGSECVSCPGSEVPVDVRGVVARADMRSFGIWLQASFRFNEDWFDGPFRRADPAEVGSSFQMGGPGGVVFDGEGGKVHYQKFSCLLWDCYKPRMWKTDDTGAVAWKRKVPFASAPVQPFLVGKYLLYIGFTSEVFELVIVDGRTGRIAESFAPPGEPYGFADAALLHAPSFYDNGYIYLKGHTERRLDKVTKQTIETIPAKTYVLKVSF